MMDLSRVIWRKAARSNANGGQCVEVGVWHKDPLDDRSGRSRVEAVPTANTHATPEHTGDPEHIFLIRDSKDPDGPMLSLAPAEWDALLVSIKTGYLANLT